MVRTIVLDFLDVILLRRSARDAQQASVEDPTGWYRVNTPLLDYCKTLHTEKQIAVYLFTASAPHEYDWLQKEIDWVDGIFLSWQMGVRKGDAHAYRELAQELLVEPNETVFIDDNVHNIVAAKEAGWQGIPFTTNRDLFTHLESLL